MKTPSVQHMLLNSLLLASSATAFQCTAGGSRSQFTSLLSSLANDDSPTGNGSNPTQPQPQLQPPSESNHRRSFMKQLFLGTIGSVIASSSPLTNNVVYAAEEVDISTSLVDVYFGVGCYWHIQHEFVEAERKLLNRGDTELTSRTGYAGGTATDKEGRVCYHNFSSIADYGKLGHGEVVGMKIPQSSIGDFAKEYFDLFTAKGERVDPMDKGGEYRSLIGLPNGMDNPSYPAVEAAANAKGMTLAMGKGNDPDTLGLKKVFVYDNAKFPFYQAEVYHQFHNDFQSPAYGKKYNDLQTLAFDDGRLKITGCPDKV